MPTDSPIEPEAVELIRATTAKTLRAVASWGQVPQEDIYAVAKQVEAGWLGMCCPVCEETRCDEGCPLAPVRPTWEDPDERMEEVVRVVLDFAEARVARHDLNVKADASEIRRLAQWLAADSDHRSYGQFVRANA